MGSKRLTPTRVGKNGLKMFVVVVVFVCRVQHIIDVLCSYKLDCLKDILQ